MLATFVLAASVLLLHGISRSVSVSMPLIASAEYFLTQYWSTHSKATGEHVPSPMMQVPLLSPPCLTPKIFARTTPRSWNAIDRHAGSVSLERYDTKVPLFGCGELRVVKLKTFTPPRSSAARPHPFGKICELPEHESAESHFLDIFLTSVERSAQVLQISRV